MSITVAPLLATIDPGRLACPRYISAIPELNQAHLYLKELSSHEPRSFTRKRRTGIHHQPNPLPPTLHIRPCRVRRLPTDHKSASTAPHPINVGDKRHFRNLVGRFHRGRRS